jgi:hypothetical protein
VENTSRTLIDSRPLPALYTREEIGRTSIVSRFEKVSGKGFEAPIAPIGGPPIKTLTGGVMKGNRVCGICGKRHGSPRDTPDGERNDGAEVERRVARLLGMLWRLQSLERRARIRCARELSTQSTREHSLRRHQLRRVYSAYRRAVRRLVETELD